MGSLRKYFTRNLLIAGVAAGMLYGCGGSNTEVEGEVEGEKPSRVCDLNRFYRECGDIAAAAGNPECCENVGCTFIYCSYDEVSNIPDIYDQIEACVERHRREVSGPQLCSGRRSNLPERYVQCCMQPRNQ